MKTWQALVCIAVIIITCILIGIICNNTNLTVPAAHVPEPAIEFVEA